MNRFEPTPIVLRLKIAALIAVAGGLVAAVLFGPGMGMPGNELLGIWGASALGAGLAGFLTAALFGQKGRDRHIWAALGAVSSTALGAAFGGLFYFVPANMVSDYGTLRIQDLYKLALLSPMVVGMGLLSIKSGPVWAILMSLVHVIAGQMRRAA